MGLLIVYAAGRGLVGSAAKPFWCDELLTLAVASRPSLRDLWTALARYDTQPPLFYLVERMTLALPIQREIAFRLPSILGFCCTLICVFAYVRKRRGDLIACLCATLLLSTSLFYTYLVEARGYSLMVACIAFALVCYQRLPSLRWAALLGISLLLAESFHYYAVFAMIPFGLAEAIFVLKIRQVRWSVWLALSCGALPLIVFWHLLMSMKEYYGSHVAFSNPALSSLPDYYGAYFFVDSAYGIGLAVIALAAISWTRLRMGAATLQWANVSDDDLAEGALLAGLIILLFVVHRAYGIGLAAIALAAISWTRLRKRAPTLQRVNVSDSDLAESALLAGLIILPFVIFPIVRLTHATLTTRYALPATIGITLGVACALSLAGPRAVALFALIVLSSIGLRECRFWQMGDRPESQDVLTLSAGELAQIEELVESGKHFDLPVVVGPGLEYMQIAYYSRASWKSRALYLNDEQKELSFVGTDSIVKIMAALRESIPLRLADYSEFTATHREFLLYSDGSVSDWDLAYLNRTAASVQQLGMRGNRRLYLIGMKKGPSAD